MELLRTQFNIPDGIALLLMAALLCFVVQYVVVSRRKLQAMIDENKKQASFTGSGGRYPDDLLKPKWLEKKSLFSGYTDAPTSLLKLIKSSVSTQALKEAAGTAMPEAVLELKTHIRQQQKTLDQLTGRINKLEMQQERSKTDNKDTANTLQNREAELQKTKQQLSAMQKVAGRVTETYQELDLLQQKLAEAEETAGKANNLAIELEEMQEAYEQLKQETRQMHQQITRTEDKLTDAALQRQQLQKRIKLLEDMNAEMQQIADNNQKMKAELRRIAELESMLSLVSNERDLLLKKRVV